MNTFFAHFYVLLKFMEWMAENGEDQSGLSPDELVAYQKRAAGDDRYRVLDLVEGWMRTIRGRAKSKERYYSAVKSFFLHNRAELPRDPGFRISVEVPPVVGSLTHDEIRKAVVKSNRLYRAVFLCMVSGGMGCSEVVEWSNARLADLKKQLDAGVRPIRVDLPGRKKLKNRRSYHTFLGRDAIDAIMFYMKT
ncbi:MAG: hypothetical protein ABSA11_08220 [Candidatus Bathyarchaeia archaeon]|jgi:hypothetical protein